MDSGEGSEHSLPSPKRRTAKRTPSVLVGILEKSDTAGLEEELQRREQEQLDIVSNAEDVIRRFAHKLSDRVEERDETRKTLAKMEELHDEMGQHLGAVLGPNASQAMASGQAPEQSVLAAGRRRTLKKTPSVLVGILETGGSEELDHEVARREQLQNEVLHKPESEPGPNPAPTPCPPG